MLNATATAPAAQPATTPCPARLGSPPWKMGMLWAETVSPEKTQDHQDSWGEGNGGQARVAGGHG